MAGVEAAPQPVAAPEPVARAFHSECASAAPQSESEREIMVAYWQAHSTEATVETMMLDTKAKELDASERPEIMGLLPASLEGLRVLELGAGIGRFTGLLAQRKARSVHAVDFMPNLIEENERIHACLGNTSFEAADVMAMEFAPSSYDFVFTNWLFMYLNDAELGALVPRLLRSLTPGGRLFFRESCNKQSGDRSRAFNPSHYRTADHYTQLFESVVEAGGARLELESHGSVKTYVELKGNPNQIYWMWRRV